MTRNEILQNTIGLFGPKNGDPMAEEFDFEGEGCVNVIVASGDWLLKQCFERTSAKERVERSFDELLESDNVWFNLYVMVGRTAEDRRVRVMLEVASDECEEDYDVPISDEEKEAFIELAETYCKASENMSVDEILDEAEVA